MKSLCLRAKEYVELWLIGFVISFGENQTQGVSLGETNLYTTFRQRRLIQAVGW